MNLVCIVLGLLCLVFAVHAFQVKGCLICCTVSLGGCGVTLLCQIWEIAWLCRIGDFAAVDDTLGARLLAGCVLLGLVLGLNVLALLRGQKQKGCTTC